VLYTSVLTRLQLLLVEFPLRFMFEGIFWVMWFLNLRPPPNECFLLILKAAMAEWLCSLARTNKVLCWNLGTNRHRMTLDTSLTAVRLGSPGRCILMTCDIHRPLWLVDMYEELYVRPVFCPQLQLVTVIGKISGKRNCLRTASYTPR
jgi:hypothetical protein